MNGKNTSNGTAYLNNYNIMTMGCTSEELENAFRRFNDSGEVLPILRDYLHENVHYIQFSTTTAGYYSYLIELYQLQRMIACVRSVLGSKGYKYPLISNILDVKTHKTINQLAAHHYYYWTLGELIRAYFWGDLQLIHEYTEYIMNGAGLFDYFGEMDLELKRIYGISDRDEGKRVYESEKLEKEFRLAAAMEAGTNLNFTAIVESEALLAEYWYDEVADQRLIRLLDKTTMTGEHMQYLLPLILFKMRHKLDINKKDDFLAFKLGFHAICQIVLNSPLLPYQKRGFFLPEIDITKKFIMLIWCCKVPLPRTEEDYKRYIDEVIQKYHLKQLDENYKEIKRNEEFLMNRMLYPSNTKEKLFISAQKMFRREPLSYYYFMNGKYTNDDGYAVKFSDGELNYPLDKIECVVFQFMKIYYKELLYIYNPRHSKRFINIKTPVKFSNKTMREIEFWVEHFNRGLQQMSSYLPLIKVVNEI